MSLERKIRLAALLFEVRFLVDCYFLRALFSVASKAKSKSVLSISSLSDLALDLTTDSVSDMLLALTKWLNGCALGQLSLDSWGVTFLFWRYLSFFGSLILVYFGVISTKIDCLPSLPALSSLWIITSRVIGRFH